MSIYFGWFVVLVIIGLSYLNIRKEHFTSKEETSEIYLIGDDTLDNEYFVSDNFLCR